MWQSFLACSFSQRTRGSFERKQVKTSAPGLYPRPNKPHASEGRWGLGLTGLKQAWFCVPPGSRISDQAKFAWLLQ